MLRLLAILPLLFVVDPSNTPAVLPATENTISIHDLQGSWKRVETARLRYSDTHPLLAPDADEYTTYYRTNVQVKNDSLYVFEYPCKYLGASSICIKNGDSLYYNGSRHAAGKLARDPHGGWTLRSFHPEWKTRPVTEQWTPDAPDPAITQLLRKNHIDYGYLAGQYMLITWVSPIDSEGYDRVYPVDVPAYMAITGEQQARQAVIRQRLVLVIGGKARDFRVTRLCWTENDYARQEENGPGFFLEPGSWWKGTPFLLYYRFTGKNISPAALKQVRKAGTTSVD